MTTHPKKLGELTKGPQVCWYGSASPMIVVVDLHLTLSLPPNDL